MGQGGTEWRKFEEVPDFIHEGKQSLHRNKVIVLDVMTTLVLAW